MVHIIIFLKKNQDVPDAAEGLTEEETAALVKQQDEIVYKRRIAISTMYVGFTALVVANCLFSCAAKRYNKLAAA